MPQRSNVYDLLEETKKKKAEAISGQFCVQENNFPIFLFLQGSCKEKKKFWNASRS